MRKCLPYFVTLQLLLVFQGCSEIQALDSEQRVQNAEQHVIEELKNSVDEGQPIESHEALADKLNLPMSRAEAIIVGDRAPGLFAQRIASSKLDFICAGDVCICTGDLDCNDMFEGPCNDPTSNGVCFEFPGGGVVCMCNPRFMQ